MGTLALDYGEVWWFAWFTACKPIMTWFITVRAPDVMFLWSLSVIVHEIFNLFSIICLRACKPRWEEARKYIRFFFFKGTTH